MAHRGKYYPVAFRRDFNFQSDIRSLTTIAHDYQITLGPGFGAPFDLAAHVFDCPPGPMPDNATLEWRSAATGIAGHLWAARLRIRFNHLPDTILQATVDLFRDAAIVATWRWISESRTDPLLHGGLADNTLLYVDFTVFPTGIDVYHSSAAPAGY